MVKEHRPWHQQRKAEWKASQGVRPMGTAFLRELGPPRFLIRLQSTPPPTCFFSTPRRSLFQVNFSGDSNTFQAALKDERDIPRFRRSKTIKPHPAARLSSNVLFHKMDRILLVSTPDHSPPHPSQAHLYSAIKVTARSNFKCVSTARWWCGGNKRTSELL